MTPEQQAELVLNLYNDIFTNADLNKFDQYFTEDFVEDNNYDVLDHSSMIAHIKDLASREDKAKFDIEFIVNVPGQVVIRTIVTYLDQIQGAPPLSLLVSYWGITEDGKFNRCIEVEHSEPMMTTDSDDDDDS